MPLKLTVAKKVIGGAGILVVVGTLAMLVIYHGLTSVATVVQRLAHVRLPITDAAHEMEINVNGITLAVLGHLGAPDPRYRALVAEDEADFERFHARYVALAKTGKEVELGERIDRLYREFKALGQGLMERRDAQETISGGVVRAFEELDTMIDEAYRRTGEAGRPDALAVREALDKLEADLAEVSARISTYPTTPTPESKERLSRSEREFRQTLERLRGLHPSPAERRWVQAIGKAFDEAMGLAGQVLALADLLRAQSKTFVELRSLLDDLLDDEMQVLARTQLDELRSEAENATSAVLRQIGWLIPAFLLSAGGVAFLVIRSVLGPVRTLIRGTRAIGQGDLSHRIAAPGQDEFGELAAEFNRMVVQLEATTVSKALLEASEQKLQDTVAKLRQEIADRARAEEERGRLQVSLRSAETMSGLGALVAGVAHSVRNPLFGVSSVLDAMEARFGARQEYQRYLEALREQVGRLAALIQQLFEYGKPAGETLRPGSVADVMGEAVGALRGMAAERGVGITKRLDGDLPPIPMDRTRLARVFENLLENAIQHSPSGGVVTVESRAVRDDARAWTECRIADSGPGIPADDLPRIFEPFFSRRAGGTGLGLAIVARVVEEHGGTVSAANRPDVGTVVTVRLPLGRA